MGSMEAYDNEGMTNFFAIPIYVVSIKVVTTPCM